MDKKVILDFMEGNSYIQGIEEMQYKPDFCVVRFFYVYEDDELEAARDYANTNSKPEEGEDQWNDEYYIPYIIDLAVDEVRDMIEELVETYNLNSEYISYRPEREDDSCEFIAVFTDEGLEFNIDDILEAMGI